MAWFRHPDGIIPGDHPRHVKGRSDDMGSDGYYGDVDKRQVWKSRWMPDPLKKNREKFYYNKTGIDIQNPVTPERSYEIPFELKRSVPTHISREVLLHITGFTSDQRIERKFSFLMTDKASVKTL